MRPLLSAIALSLVLAGAQGAEPAVDLYGDPLPPGAIARLGTTRWRVPADATIRFSPDGKVLFAVSNTRLQKFDAVTGRELSSLKLKSYRGTVVADFNPRLDRLVTVDSKTGTDLHTVIIRDATNGKQLLDVTAPEWAIGSAVLSPDGKLLATRGCRSAAVCLWNAITGEKVRQLGNVQNSSNLDLKVTPDNVAFSSDGKLAVASEFGDLLLYDYHTGKKLPGPDKGNRKQIKGLAFSPDDRLLACYEGGDGFGIWDIAAERQLCRIPPNENKNPIVAFRFSPDGKVLITAANDGLGTIRFWDTATGKEMPHGPDAVRYWNGPSGRRKMVASEDSFMENHEFGLSFALSPDGSALAVVDRGIIRLISPDLKESDAPVGHESSIFQVDWSADGAIVASAGDVTMGFPSFRTWDVRSSKQLQEFHKDLRYGRYNHFALAPDGRSIAVSYPLRLHDTITGASWLCRIPRLAGAWACSFRRTARP